METYYYVEELPLALECGMTPEQFWDGDRDLIFAYKKQYVNKLHKKAHIEGLYNYIGLYTVLGNMFSEKGAEMKQYPEYPIANPYLDESKQNQGNNDNKSLELNSEENLNNLYNAKERFLERMKQNGK